MCIAILKTKGNPISDEVLKTCSNNNPDGCGFAYVDDGVIRIFKTLDFNEFLIEYKKVEDKSNMLLHFRIATHGKVNVNNCHPFKLNHRMALIHNGIISGYGDSKSKDDGLTDTQDFINKTIGNIGWKNWKNPAFRELVGKAIGYSKFCILDVSGDYTIINESAGYWVDGNWYSNKSYEPKKYTATRYNDCDWGTYKYNKELNRWLPTERETKKEVLEDKIIMMCKHCNKTFKTDEGFLYPTCPDCGRISRDEVGFEIDGVDYLYDDNGCVDSKKDKQLSVNNCNNI